MTRLLPKSFRRRLMGTLIQVVQCGSLEVLMECHSILKL
jgi:hypothetical protein